MRAAVVLAVATLASALPASAASTKSSFTDVSSCRSVDFQVEEFAHFCKGPAGMAAVLYYFDGRAIPTFGPAAKGKRDQVRDGAGGDMEPLAVDATGKPYGDKIEWVSVGSSAPCAAIVRMSLEAGSRLVVTSIGAAPERIAVVKGNREAQAAAAKACGGASGGQRAEAEAPEGKATPLAYKKIGLGDPLSQKLWADSMTEIKAVGGNVEVFRADFERGKDAFTIVQIWSGWICGTRACETKIMKNGKVVESELLCSSNDDHLLSADKRTITFCDHDVRIR